MNLYWECLVATPSTKVVDITAMERYETEFKEIPLACSQLYYRLLNLKNSFKFQ